jgi:hypothetical protein
VRPSRIAVVRASYGENCAAARGNVTTPLAQACDGRDRCEYRADYTLLGDPAVGCSKELAVDWRCGEVFHRRVLPGEAGIGARLELTCAEEGQPAPVETPSDRGPIRVMGATYGQNCGVAEGNATAALARACDGHDRCDYHVDASVLGDPRVGCAKNFVVEWQCQRSERRFRQVLPGESGFGSLVTLLCAP